MNNNFFMIEETKFISLNHVSHISLDYTYDKVIFKMDYAVDLQAKKRGHDKDSQAYNLYGANLKKYNEEKKKLVTGYIYAYNINEILKRLDNNKYFKDVFVQKSLDNDSQDMGWINLEKITSLKFDDARNRVVVNFSNSVTYYDFTAKEEILTSEFLYLDFTNDEKFKKYSEYLKNTLESKNGN